MHSNSYHSSIQILLYQALYGRSFTHVMIGPNWGSGKTKTNNCSRDVRADGNAQESTKEFITVKTVRPINALEI